MTNNKTEVVRHLQAAGVNYEDACAIRRISMTLHRWHERECGCGNGCIERDEKTDKPFWRFNGDSKLWPIADREAGALKRLGKIMQRYTNLSAYVQGDPRGASLFILRPKDVPVGENVEGYYSNGIAVYQ